MSPWGFEPTLDAAIETSPRAPSEARRAVEKFAARLDPGALRDVQLIVSELVTNSVRHSGSLDPIQLRAWPRPNGMRFEVADGGYGFDRLGGPVGPAAEGGRGLLILDTLAARWGVSRDARTRVWFEIEPRPEIRRHAQAG